MVEAIYIACEKGGSMQRIVEARVVVDRGLEGDRYFDGRGSFSRWPGGGRAVSMIAAEAIENIAAEHGIDLCDGKSRRNIVTRGVELESLVNQSFQIGEAILFGNRLCSPCRYLERLIAPGLYDAIKGRGGLRADVVRGGMIRAGDKVRPLSQLELTELRATMIKAKSFADEPHRRSDHGRVSRGERQKIVGEGQ